MTERGTGAILGAAADAAAGEAFWTFALDLYARPGVAAACIELQDEHGLDVPVLLLACWLGERGVAPGPDWWRAAAAASTPWREQVVAPLRAMRRYLKHARIEGVEPEAIAALRSDVARDELAAERIAMLTLGRTCAGLPATGEPTGIATSRNLQDYATSQGRTPTIIAGLVANLVSAK